MAAAKKKPASAEEVNPEDVEPSLAAPEGDTPTDTQPAPQTIPALRVSAKVAGFRRAGRAWPVDPVVVPLADLTSDQIGQLLAEPKLVVTTVEIDG